VFEKEALVERWVMNDELMQVTTVPKGGAEGNRLVGRVALDEHK
jgi:hypothetical protein